MKKTAPNCVQCLKEMLHAYGNSEWSAPFCEYPECPNYGLLQAIIDNKKSTKNYKTLEQHSDDCEMCPRGSHQD